MSVKLDSLRKLYIMELKDLYSAENQLLDVLPDMEEAANDDGLKKAFSHHLEETKNHISRLEQIFEKTDYSPGGHRCEAMAGLIKEGKEFLKSKDIDEHVRDAALVAAAQRCEHYEIAAYGTARAYAEKLGDYEAADLLQETLNEEGAANQKLSHLAERSINFGAMMA